MVRRLPLAQDPCRFLLAQRRTGSRTVAVCILRHFFRHPRPGRIYRSSVDSPSRGVPRMALFRPLIYLWALPTTLLGMVFVPEALLSGGVCVVDGVLEVHGRLASFFLRRCTLLRRGASAMTLGHVVIARDQHLLEATRAHERVHVRQCERR